MNKVKVILVILICTTLFSSCWNYRGLDTLDIVSGMAFDIDEETGEYLLTFEVVDTKSSDSSGPPIKYVESYGKTVFDAIRNTKKRLTNSLYGGNMETIIISSKIAETEGVHSVLEEIMRDSETRETLSVIISQEKTAQDILLSQSFDYEITSYVINEIVIEDSKNTASTIDVPLYKIQNTLKSPGDSLLLPAIRCIDNNGDEIPELNGIAVFKQDKLVDYISAKQSMFCLFILDKIQGASFSFDYVKPSGDIRPVTVEIRGSNTKTSLDYIDDQLVIEANIKTTTNTLDLKGAIDLSKIEERKLLEKAIGDAIAKNTSDFFYSSQVEFGFDIFGMGNKLYKSKPHLWYKLKDNWDEIFSNAKYIVNVQVDNQNTGVIENY